MQDICNWIQLPNVLKQSVKVSEQSRHYELFISRRFKVNEHINFEKLSILRVNMSLTVYPQAVLVFNVVQIPTILNKNSR